ncbi:MAG: sulfur carrier protein ThiS [Colwellia sp.]|nr:sulfur carrier protein ThiS [Colwellia sp.]
MKVLVNGQGYELALPTEQNLQQALQLFLNNNQHQGTFAVALNGEFIGKESYQNTQLSANDSVDVLFPIQGG